MKLVSVKINNFKSFGNEENLLFLDNLNVVVGKNESGKSNLVESIGLIKRIGYTPRSFFENVNRSSNSDVSVDLVFKPSVKDVELIGYGHDISLTIRGYDICEYDDKFAEFILEQEDIYQLVDNLREFRENNNIPLQNPKNIDILNDIYDRFERINKQFFIIPDEYDGFIDTLYNSNSNILNELGTRIDIIKTKFDKFLNVFPRFIFINNQNLQSIYTSEEYKSEISKSQNSILYQFLDIVGIDCDEMKKTIDSDDSVEIKNNSDKFNKLVKSNFTDKFNEFYKQEAVDIYLQINGGNLNILVKTKGVYLEYSERSNGLKWYLNIFIQLLFREKNDSNISTNNVLVLDEPGVFLHSIAQKELLGLFSNLVKNDNQIIYTTHSPSMIDFDNIQNVRAVEKNQDGYSCIVNKISNFPTDSDSKYETITPIVNAMGYKIAFNVGANYQKTNILVEGITDYFYLESYLHQKNITKYNIIASTGADNIPAIASILYGWGCQFVIVLDHDDKGRSIYDSIKDSNMPFLNKTLFVDSEEYNKKNDFEIEDLFSAKDKEKYSLSANDYQNNKYYYSYSYLERIIADNDKIDKDSLKRFAQLFDNIEKKINL